MSRAVLRSKSFDNKKQKVKDSKKLEERKIDISKIKKTYFIDPYDQNSPELPGNRKLKSLDESCDFSINFPHPKSLDESCEFSLDILSSDSEPESKEEEIITPQEKKRKGFLSRLNCLITSNSTEYKSCNNSKHNGDNER